MLRRQKTGSVVCVACGKLVGVNDPVCMNCGRRNPGLWGFAPMLRRLGNDLGFVTIVTGACSALYAASLLVDTGGIRTGGMLSFLAPSTRSLFMFGASGAIPVFGYDRWWTFLSAGWLHGGLLHILFNLLWIRQLAPATAELYGAPRMIVLYTASSVAGFVLSSAAGFYLAWFPIGFLRGAQFTIGASAAIFGLLGALVYYGRRTGSSYVGSQAKTYAVILFVFGFIMPGIDNFAHLGGFLGGYGISAWLDPMKPERIDHVILALACLVGTALSILASLLTGFALR
ncbi:MAG: rhomboid family intramembrane serine protease [Acidobacteria bacterium]|nr:rhomboid family intramembrane serine protease [Acidobacteriota bacterium]